MPLPSELVAPPATPRWWTLTTYWVQLHAIATDPCGGAPCFEALLLDGGSDSP
jgi:hypothetical protein